MAANSLPMFTRVPKINWTGNITAANTAKDGTGTTLTLFTADGTNGSFVARIIGKPAGTNVTSVVRVFINNGSTSATASNNSFVMEIDLPAITLSEIATMGVVERAINIPLPPGYKLLVALGTAVAAGWTFTAVGGDY